MKIKLVNILSYAGHGIYVTKDNPIADVSEKTAEALLATGWFTTVGEEQEDSEVVATEDYSEEIKTVAGYTKKQLVEFANEKGVDITGCKTKADILTVFSEELWGGCCTMAELQKL